MEAFIDKVVLANGKIEISGWAIGKSSKYLKFVLLENGYKKTFNISHVVREDVIKSKKLLEENYECGFEIKASVDTKKSYCLVVLEGDSKCELAIDIKKSITKQHNEIFKYICKKIKKGCFTEDLVFILKKGYKKYEESVIGCIQKQDENYDRLREQWEKNKNVPTIEEDILVSVVVPIYNTLLEYLKELIVSIKKQSYTKWELCLVDAGTNGKIEKYIKKQCKDNRIKYKKINKNLGISENTNVALKMAKGDLILFLDHDDFLDKNAFYYCVEAYLTGAEIIYSDQDKVTKNFHIYYEPFFKPDYNKDYLYSVNYMCHLFAVKKEILNKVGRLHKEYDGAQDYDFILRCCQNSNKIVHIPKVLYHWRVHDSSVAENETSKIYAYEAGRKAIQDALYRDGIKGEVLAGPRLGLYQIEYPYDKNSLVTIIITDEIEKEVLEKNLIRTKHKKYNLILMEDIDKMQHLIGEFVLYLRNVEFETNNWLEKLLGNCQRENVAMVGPKVYNRQHNIEGGMLVRTGNGTLDVAFEGINKDLIVNFGRANVQQNCNALTNDCVMINKIAIEEKGIPIMDKLKSKEEILELCFEVREKGMTIVWDPKVCAKKLNNSDSYQLSIEYRNKWKRRLKQIDCFYNPNCNREKADYSIIKE